MYVFLRFQAHTKYPYELCFGMIVVFTGDLMPALAQASKVTPYNPGYWIDDVYLYGIVPSVLGKLSFESLYPVSSLSFKLFYNCVTKKQIHTLTNKQCPNLATLVENEQQRRDLWKITSNCAEET